jgi:hypothetical protein
VHVCTCCLAACVPDTSTHRYSRECVYSCPVQHVCICACVCACVGSLPPCMYLHTPACCALACLQPNQATLSCAYLYYIMSVVRESAQGFFALTYGVSGICYFVSALLARPSPIHMERLVLRSACMQTCFCASSHVYYFDKELKLPCSCKITDWLNSGHEHIRAKACT